MTTLGWGNGKKSKKGFDIRDLWQWQNRKKIEKHRNETKTSLGTCLSEKSPFYKNLPKCYWTKYSSNGDSSEGFCQFGTNEGNNILISFIVAAFSAIIRWDNC